MATIYEKEGMIYIAFYQKFGNKRKHIQYSLSLKSSVKRNWELAERIKEEKELELKASNSFSIKDLKLDQLLDYYFLRNSYTKNTKITYTSAVNKLINLVGNKPANQVSPEEAKKIWDADLKPETKKSYNKFLKIIFQFLKEKKIVLDNPFK